MSEATRGTGRENVAATTDSSGAVDPYEGRFAFRDRTLRQHTARGTLVNGMFVVGLSALGFLKAFIVASFLTPDDYGVWGVLIAALVAFAFLMELGIGDKYVQQDEPDQELAFQRAFTLNLLWNGVFVVALLGVFPAIAALIDQSKVLAPGLVLLLALPAAALTSPLWIYYRRMQFVRQRTLQAADPVVGFVVTIALAAAGAGYWSLVIGSVAGAWSAALLAVVTSPYRIRLRLDRAAFRNYFDFSWPLAVSNFSRLVLVQTAIFVGEWQIGLAAAGAITLAGQIAAFTNKADAVVTQTLYPAICAVRDRTELLFESFVKSNRLALMWGMPFGVGLALFAPDLVHHVLGDRWEPAIFLLQVYGLAAAFGHLGFNWDAFFRARGNTRPIAVVAVVGMAAYLGVAIPLLVWEGLDGFALGMAVMTAAGIVARSWFLTRLFDGFQMLRHAARALAPSVPAVAVVLLARAFEAGERSSAVALAELVTYLSVTVVATLLLERALLREVVAYLRRAQREQPAPVG